MQKTAPKNTKYLRNETILKIGHHACKGYSPCKIITFAQKLKFQKNMSKSILQIIYSCSVQKTALKNTKYSRNETILKIGHQTKAIPMQNAHFGSKIKSKIKSSLWLKKLKFQKTCHNPFYKSFRLVLCKKPLQKTLNIREMRPF